MAAADILRSPCQYNAMPPKQRAPLSNIPNALNSPARITSSKRNRPDGKTLLDDVPAPAAKRQHLDRDFALRQERENIPQPPQTPQKKKPVPSLVHLGHGGRSDAVDRERVQRQQALIAKEKEKAREREKQRHQRAKQEANKEDLLRWRLHYEKKFPDYVFYFENIPEETRRKYSRQIKDLGAQEDRFFSKSVTHVVTTRSLPNEPDTPLEEEHQHGQHGLPHGTINPSLLDKRTDTRSGSAGSTRAKSVFDVALSKKAGLAGDPEKQTKTAKLDVLQKAVELGIKVWQEEKFTRILLMMFSDGNDEPEHNEQTANQRNTRTTARVSKKPTDTLSKLIKKEEQSRNVAYDFHNLSKTEQIPLQEPYIFVRCMNERTKPLLVRQYPKVTKWTDGDWPQFRAVTQGKCPFIIEETRKSKVEKQPRREKEERPQQRVTRAQAAEDQQKDEAGAKLTGSQSRYFDQKQSLQPYETAEKQPLQALDQPLVARTHAASRHQTPTIKEEDEENQDPDHDEAAHDDAVLADEDATTDAPVLTPTDGNFTKPGLEQGQHSRQASFDMMAPPQPLPRPKPEVGRPGGEPTASGLQRSGATAAIRSTMGISSAAAQPGVKTGTTRDMHSLQRRVLDRYSTGGSGSTLGMSAPAVPPNAQLNPNATSTVNESRRMADVAGRARTENPRAAKLKAQEKIHVQNHPADQGNGYDVMKGAPRPQKSHDAPKVKREPKPGYCENCKDKFDDFEEHVQSRKHRKFATAKENWAGLDALLAQLDRPKKRKLETIDDRYRHQRHHSEVSHGEERANKRSRHY